MSQIVRVSAREVLDSRANPTVEAEVSLSDGVSMSAIAPSGASCGMHEAHELRDGDAGRYHGRGTLHAVNAVNEIISPALVGMDAADIDEADEVMIALDGTLNKSRFGANAILAVSEAIVKAAAASYGMPLYKYVGGALVHRMPKPMMNILNGGKHAENNLEIQEFMIVPTGAESFVEGVRASAEVYHALKKILSDSHLSTAVGDEGGFAPSLSSDEDAIKLILASIERAGYEPGVDFMLALDAAASEWCKNGEYLLPKTKKPHSSSGLVDYFSSLVDKYPILSIEDPLGEEDREGWQELSRELGKKCLLVGDDLFVTDPLRIEDGIGAGIANAALIKPNQIGTVSEAADAVRCAMRAGYKTIMSHRSGDTEDTFIADFAVGMGVDFIKSGAPCRAERTAKYNRLMKIEGELFSPTY